MPPHIVLSVFGYIREWIVVEIYIEDVAINIVSAIRIQSAPVAESIAIQVRVSERAKFQADGVNTHVVKAMQFRRL